MSEKTADKKAVVLSALISAAIGAAAAVAFAALNSALLLLTPDPAVYFLPAGLAALLAGGATAGFVIRKRTDAHAAAGLLPGIVLAAVALLICVFVKGDGRRPVFLPALLFVLIPAANFAGSLIAGRGKKRRPSMKRRPHRRR